MPLAAGSRGRNGCPAFFLVKRMLGGPCGPSEALTDRQPNFQKRDFRSQSDDAESPLRFARLRTFFQNRHYLRTRPQIPQLLSRHFSGFIGQGKTAKLRPSRRSTISTRGGCGAMPPASALMRGPASVRKGV